MYFSSQLRNYLLLFILWFNCTTFFSLFAQSATPKTTDILSSHQSRILTLIEQSQFSDAKAMLHTRNKIEPHAWNHLQLGKIYATREKWSEAEFHLKKAKTMQSGYAEAYFELGKVYMQGPYLLEDAYMEFHWGLTHNKDWLDAYYHKARIRMIERFRASGLVELEPLLLKKPSHRNAYTLYSRIAFAFHEHKKLNDFLPALIASFPDSIRFKIDLINSLYLDGDYNDALNLLTAERGNIINTMPALWYLNYARVQAALKNDRLAWKTYQLGIKSIKNLHEADEYFKDALYIVTEDEYNNYLDMSLESRKEFFHILWKSRDLTLVSDFNERFIEHYKRLRYTFKFNRRWPLRQMIDYFLTDFKDPLFQDHLMIKKYGKSTAINRQQLVDDMGCIYIRHGEPDKFYTSVSPDMLSHLSWFYNASTDRPMMIFHFDKIGRTAGIIKKDLGWVLKPQPVYPTDWVKDFTAKDIYASVALATVTTTTNFEPDIQLEYICDHYLFQGPDSSTNLLFCYDLPEKIIDTGLPQGAVLTQQLAIFDGSWKKVGSINQNDYSGTISENPIRRLHVEIPSGDFFGGFSMVNSANGGKGHTKFNIKSKFSVLLDISSIIMADMDSNIHAFEEADQRHSLADIIIPNLKRQFRQDDSIVLYFEIYHLTRDPEGRTDATITLSIKQIGTKRGLLSRIANRKKEWMKVSVDHQTQSGQKNEYILQSLVLPKYEPGQYQLDVIVVDHNSILSTKKTVDFTIKKKVYI